jgi:hypothetical protein
MAAITAYNQPRKIDISCVRVDPDGSEKTLYGKSQGFEPVINRFTRAAVGKTPQLISINVLGVDEELSPINFS